MKVLFISRATLCKIRGGDTTQVENTAIALRKLGVEVTVACSDNRHINYAAYDLIHFFNLTRPADILYHIDKCSLPFVLSPIYVQYSGAYQNSATHWQILASWLGGHSMEYLKSVGRWIKNGEKIMSLKYLFLGHHRSVAQVLRRCQLLLPNSISEQERLKSDFEYSGVHRVIPNGVDQEMFHLTLPLAHKKNAVLCVARIEPQKNQLQLIKALQNTDYTLTLVGDPAPNHKQYYNACKRAAGKNVQFLGFKDQQVLTTLYRSHKVHVLPSWFETTGLCSLEAAACGSNIVVSNQGDTPAYFKGYATFCDPADPASILQAITHAMEAKLNLAFCRKIEQTYNWDQAAALTYEAYGKIMNRQYTFSAKKEPPIESTKCKLNKLP